MGQQQQQQQQRKQYPPPPVSTPPFNVRPPTHQPTSPQPPPLPPTHLHLFICIPACSPHSGLPCPPSSTSYIYVIFLPVVRFARRRPLAWGSIHEAVHQPLTVGHGAGRFLHCRCCCCCCLYLHCSTAPITTSTTNRHPIHTVMVLGACRLGIY